MLPDEGELLMALFVWVGQGRLLTLRAAASYPVTKGHHTNTQKNDVLEERGEKYRGRGLKIKWKKHASFPLLLG